MTRPSALGLLVLFVILLAIVPRAAAQRAAHVAVVINDDSVDSQQVGSHYVRARSIPASNVIHIRTPAVDTISRATYTSAIEGPIRRALGRERLQDRVLYIVLTKGVPLRLEGSEGPEGTAASVDSELTLLYRRMVGSTVPTTGRVANPYYLGTAGLATARPFSHRSHDIYLVTRLDAFTADEAVAVIDRAQKPAAKGQFVLDQSAGTRNNPLGDLWLSDAGRRLSELGWREEVVLEQTRTPARNLDNVIGYASWASNDPQNRVRRTEMRFLPGGLATTFASADARTFTAPPAEWVPSGNWQNRATWFEGAPDTLIGDLIREGATGVAGSVSDPFLQSAVRPWILFPAYVNGFNLAESFYLAMPHLSWKSVIVGDPLCAPFPRRGLTAADLEESLDTDTELPALFAKRRMEALRATAKDASPEAIAPFMLAESRLARGETAGAITALERVVELAPQFPGAQMQLALLYEQTRDARAVDVYQKILVREPNNVVALNNLAYATAVQRNAPADAKPLAQKAATLAPKDPNVADTLAWIEHLLGNPNDAERLIAVAVKGAPSNPDIRLHAAFIYAAAQQLDTARKELTAALTLNPEFSKRDDVQQLEQRLPK